MDALSALARRWTEGADELQGQLLAGIGEAGARMLLRDPKRWTPEKLGGRLGGAATRALALDSITSDLPRADAPR